MKRLATVTSLLLAIGGAAGAQPWYGNGPRPGPMERGRPYDRGGDEGFRHHGGGHGRYQGWVTIADRFDAGVGRQTITLGDQGQGERFQQLSLVGEYGAPYIDSLIVRFQDGSWQRVRVGQRLREGQEMAIDLHGGSRVITRIIVNAAPGERGAYSLYGY